MFDNIKARLVRFVKNNTGIKLMAVVLSFCIWLIIVNYDNPTVTRTFTNIPIEIINEETITSNEMVYTVQGTQTASVRVRCSRRVAESLKTSDFKAVADFNDLYSLTNQIPVTITCSNSRVSADEITPLTYSLSVELENVVTKTMTVESVIEGEPADGYLVGDVTCSPSTVQISAPNSLLDQVSFVGVSVNVDGLSQTTNRTLSLQFYNAGGNLLDSSVVEGLTVSQSSIDVEVEILNVKSVNINYTVTGQSEVADGYIYAGIDLSTSSVQISGRKTVLAEVSALTIPDGELDITGASEDVVKTFDMRELLPEGVTLVDQETYSVTVTIRIERLETREYSLQLSQVDFVNMEENLLVSNTDTQFTVSVQGTASDLNNLNSSEITAVVDMDGLGAGTHWLSPEVSVPKGFTATNVPRVVVRVESTEESTTTAESAEETDTVPADEDPTDSAPEEEAETEETSEETE